MAPKPSRVFVVQRPARYDVATGKHEPLYDVGPAREFGQVRVMLAPMATPSQPGAALAELRRQLADFGPQDFLLLMGNPVLLALASIVAADQLRTPGPGGPLQFLQWSKAEKRYIVIRADVTPS